MRNEILKMLENNSRIDLHDLAIMLGTDESMVLEEIDKCGYFFCICFIPVNQCRITADNALILHFFDFF